MSFSVEAPHHKPGAIDNGWIAESYHLFEKAAGIWIAAMLIVAVIPVGTALFNRAYGHPDLLIRLAQLAFGSVVSAFFAGGMFAMANKQVRGQPIDVRDLFAYGKYTGWFILFRILFALALGAGLIVFILPAFVLFAVLWPANALIADGVRLGEAMSRSIEAVQKDWLKAGLFCLVFLLLYAASFLACGLGELITTPMAMITASLVYRDLINMPKARPAGAVEVESPVVPDDGSVWPPRPKE